MKIDKVLIVSMGPYRFSTRTRKAAQAYLGLGEVTFVGLQGVGRTGKRDVEGSWRTEGIEVVQVGVRAPATSPSRRSQTVNLLRSYLPAFVRLCREIWRRPADVVHVTGVPLILLGLLHTARHGSRLVVDVNERPASVSARGSLFSTFARAEPVLLRLAARRAAITTVVTPGHLELLQADYGFSHVLVVRNAPMSQWRAPYVEQPEKTHREYLRVVTVGTLFEGRAFEMLIEAVSRANSGGLQVVLDVYGAGRADYESSLKQLARDLGVQDHVTFHGRVEVSGVSAAYLTGHLGLALYDPADSGNDSLSNKILECVSSGRPVLAGDLTENRRFVVANDVGWLTDVTAEAIAAALVELSGEPNFVSISRRCRALGDQELTWEAEFDKVLKALASDRSQMASAA